MSTRKKGTGTDAGDDKSFAQAVRDSAQQIWLAGLGAFSKAQDEGLKVFEALVRQGSSVERRTRMGAGQKIDEVAGTVNKVAGDLGRHATESWDKLEQVFESRVERALARMGVPTRGELDKLSAQVEALTKAVESLGASAKKASARPRTRAAAKPAGAAKAAKPAGAARKPRATKAAGKAAKKRNAAGADKPAD